MKPFLISAIEILRTSPNSFLLQDLTSGKNFHLDNQTRYLVRLLDGNRTLEQIREAYRGQFSQELPERVLHEFLEQLRRLGMLSATRDMESPGSLRARSPDSAQKRVNKKRQSAINARFDILAALFGWTMHPLTLLPVTLLAISAAVALIRNWERFELTYYHFWHSIQVPPLILLPYLAAWLITFTMGAIATGIACRQFGGHIRALYFGFYLGLLPLVYCDTGDSFISMQRRGKWVMLTVRLWTYLAIGSCAALFWRSLPFDSDLTFFFRVLVIVCSIAVLAGVIVFFPGDGYRIVSYLCKDPRLRERALAETSAWLSMRQSEEALGDRERWRLRRFGLGIYLTYSVFGIAALMFVGRWFTDAYGARGALIVIALILLVVYKPVVKMIKSTMHIGWAGRFGGGVYYRWTVRLLFIAGCVIFGILPYNYDVSGQCRIIPSAEFGARAQISGEIAEIHVREGDRIPGGTRLVTLSNPKISIAPDIIRKQLDRARAELELVVSGTRSEDIEIAKTEVSRSHAELKLSEAELTRIQDLSNRDLAPEAQLDRERYQYDAAEQQVIEANQKLARAKAGNRAEEIDSAKALVLEMEASLRQAEKVAEMLTISTPVSGRVVTQYLLSKGGQFVEPGDLLMIINNYDNLQVEIAAEENAGLLARSGAPVDVRLNALDGRLLTAHVVSIAHYADKWLPTELSRTDKEYKQQESLDRGGDEHRFRIIAEFNQPVADLKPGMLGYARIFIREEMLWQSIARPVLRFFRTEVWSWIP